MLDRYQKPASDGESRESISPFARASDRHIADGRKIYSAAPSAQRSRRRDWDSPDGYFRRRCRESVAESTFLREIGAHCAAIAR